MDATASQPDPVAIWLSTASITHGCMYSLTDFNESDVVRQADGTYMGTCPGCGKPFWLNPPWNEPPTD
jgi:hypothetical protein